MRALFREYQAGLGIDLGFQDFEVELEGLPGRYAPPHGALICAESGAALVGCVALRALVDELVARARRMGYASICLDTIPGMEAAQRLYACLGFHDTPACASNPIPGTCYLALDLRGGTP